jgi:hypothetical protein
MRERQCMVTACSKRYVCPSKSQLGISSDSDCSGRRHSVPAALRSYKIVDPRNREPCCLRHTPAQQCLALCNVICPARLMRRISQSCGLVNGSLSMAVHRPFSWVADASVLQGSVQNRLPHEGVLVLGMEGARVCCSAKDDQQGL